MVGHLWLCSQSVSSVSSESLVYGVVRSVGLHFGIRCVQSTPDRWNVTAYGKSEFVVYATVILVFDLGSGVWIEMKCTVLCSLEVGDMEKEGTTNRPSLFPHSSPTPCMWMLFWLPAGWTGVEGAGER